MLKDLSKPKPIPEELSMQQRLVSMYEAAGPMAFTTMFSLLFSPQDVVKFNAAREILNKIMPPVPQESFTFLMKKSEEELLAIIAGSGVFDQLREFLPKGPSREIIDAAQIRIGETGEADDGVPGIPTE